MNQQFKFCALLLLFWIKTSSSLAKDSAHQCFEGMVYVANPESKSGCYPKVGLDRECEFSIQCSTSNVNSYCGFNPSPDTLDRLYKVCLCDEGYSNFVGHYHRYDCLPIRNCSNAHFNPYLEQNDCGDWQFCRQGICHCKPDLMFDATGNCVAIDGSPPDDCPQGQIYVKTPESRKGCYQKVRLFDECQFTGQCNETTNAFCGWSTSNGKNPVCQCADGYKPDVEFKKCIPIKACAGKDFNEGLDQADCEENQFCRNRVCYCKPDHEFNILLGQCIRTNLENLEDFDSEDESQPISKETNWPVWITIIISVIFSVLSLFYALFLCQTRKDDKLERLRKNSSDVEMMEFKEKLNPEVDEEEEKNNIPETQENPRRVSFNLEPTEMTMRSLKESHI